MCLRHTDQGSPLLDPEHLSTERQPHVRQQSSGRFVDERGGQLLGPVAAHPPLIGQRGELLDQVGPQLVGETVGLRAGQRAPGQRGDQQRGAPVRGRVLRCGTEQPGVDLLHPPLGDAHHGGGDAGTAVSATRVLLLGGQGHRLGLADQPGQRGQIGGEQVASQCTACPPGEVDLPAHAVQHHPAAAVLRLPQDKQGAGTDRPLTDVQSRRRAGPQPREVQERRRLRQPLRHEELPALRVHQPCRQVGLPQSPAHRRPVNSHPGTRLHAQTIPALPSPRP